ncbi:MAG: SDR family oxidoreductase [Bdellovibrionales bacterium]|nr:SDR family oxidoreductase [Bdellovibrionales bacterium]
MLNIDLSGYRALVCGASKGIGAETARTFAQAGARVTLVARSEADLKEVLQSLSGDGHQILALDLNDTQKIAEQLEKTDLKNHPYTILVCNAGGPKAGPLVEAEAQSFLDGFKTHVLANQTLAQALLPGMKAKKYGRIINIISTSVKIPIPNLGVSNTIRGAVANWAKTLANEVGEFGITVNNVLPGFTETERLETLIQAASERFNQTPEQIAETWKGYIPTKRFAKPQETAQTIAFLASPLASYINGINLPVDGGRTGSL